MSRRAPRKLRGDNPKRMSSKPRLRECPRPVKGKGPKRKTTTPSLELPISQEPLMYSRINLGAPPLYVPREKGGVPDDFGGLDDASLYNGNKEGLDIDQWFMTLLHAILPIPGAGSYLPHIYVPLVAELFLRSTLIVWLLVLVWAVVEIALYWSLKRFSIPVQWPTKQALDPETLQVYDYVDYEDLYITTGLWNPLIGTIGLGVAWYLIRLFDLEPFREEYDWLLILFLVLFFFVAVHQGKNTAWLFVTFGLPVFILGIQAPIFGAYTRDFGKFAPYLFWVLVNVWFSIWFVRDPFARAGKKMFFSLDGTYAWNAFFATTLLVVATSLWKVIDLSR